MDRIMPDIIKEFYIISDLKMQYTDIVQKFPIEPRTQAKDLKDINKGIYTDKLEFLSDISSYKIGSSKLLETKYGYLLNECIEKVFNRIHKEFEENDVSLTELLMHKNMTEYWWRPLMDYNVWSEEYKPDKVVVVEEFERYERKNGMWSRTRYSGQREYKNIVGYILKTMECYIRDYLGYRKLKFPDKKEILKDIDEYYCSASKRRRVQKVYKMNLEQIIEEETMSFLNTSKIPKMVFKKTKKDENEFEKEEKVEVVFNQEEFAKIRAKAEEIQKALIVDEEESDERESEKDESKTNNICCCKDKLNKTLEDDEGQMSRLIIDEYKETMSAQNEQTEDVFKKFAYSLTSKEKEIVQTILEKHDVENKIIQIAKSGNEMLEVMVSNINDKALETIGDTVIEADMTSIYEDYEKEIRQAL